MSLQHFQHQCHRQQLSRRRGKPYRSQKKQGRSTRTTYLRTADSADDLRRCWVLASLFTRDSTSFLSTKNPHKWTDPGSSAILIVFQADSCGALSYLHDIAWLHDHSLQTLCQPVDARVEINTTTNQLHVICRFLADRRDKSSPLSPTSSNQGWN